MATCTYDRHEPPRTGSRRRRATSTLDPLQLRVHFGAKEEREAREPKPHEENGDGGEAAVIDGVFAKRDDVIPEAPRAHEPRGEGDGSPRPRAPAHADRVLDGVP